MATREPEHGTDDPRPSRTRSSRPSFGLRTRAAVAFGAVGLLVAVMVAGATYGLARRYLVEQREDVARQQAFVNARLARTVLRAPVPDVRTFLSGLGGATAGTPIVRYRNEWFATSVAAGRDALPAGVVKVVSESGAGHQRYRDADGRLHLAVGVALPAVDAAYFELFPLMELERTLGALRQALAVGAGSAAVAASAIGYLAARRLVRPLRPVAEAAERIASGELGTRLNADPDPDLDRLFDAFNAMAASLEERILREARFAADVSHEIRAPLAALNSAVEVIARRRDQLPADVLPAFEILSAKVERFQALVVDLLEITRIDAGVADVVFEPVRLVPFLRELLELHGSSAATVAAAPDAPEAIYADRRRLGQALGNIVDNARRYGGGVTAISVRSGGADQVVIDLDDCGPGIPGHEREAIFGRFARGEHGHRAGSGSGSGLGLALVVEHLKVHRGSVSVTDAPGGGARFVVVLPTDPRS